MSNFLFADNKITFSKHLDAKLMKTLSEVTSDEEFYQSEFKVAPEYLFQYLNELQTRAENGDYCLFELVLFLNEKFKDSIEATKNMIEDNKISFNALQNYFQPGNKIITKQEFNTLSAGVISEISLLTSPQGTKYYQIQYSQVSTNGKGAILVNKSAYIPYFRGMVLINSLETRKPTDEELETLTQRGQKFKQLIKGNFYKQYKGNMWKNTYFGPMLFKADGRCIVDPQGFKKMNPNSSSDKLSNMYDLPDDQLYMCSPFIRGFSLTSKMWGEMFVDSISEIEFDEHAYDLLVLDNKVKSIVKALIVNSKNTFSDIISGKSGGVCFLLQGAPGSGKTLLAESSSELLKKPLYSVAVGELGTEVSELEKQLTKILELATSWDAVVLIDEADIFMAKRTEHNIVHNAIVSVFLRLLERYPGVMFLTTNRNSDIDEAFKSRISITIGFDKPSFSVRYSIWKNLLNASRTILSDDDIKDLSVKYEINGRQIKNAIRMSQCLAKEENVDVNMTHLELALRYT